MIPKEGFGMTMTQTLGTFLCNSTHMAIALLFAVILRVIYGYFEVVLRCLIQPTLGFYGKSGNFTLIPVFFYFKVPCLFKFNLGKDG